MNVTPIGRQADWPVEQILKYALEENFSGVVIIGWLKEPKEGKRFWLSSSYNTEDSVIYALKCAEKLTLDSAFNET